MKTIDTLVERNQDFASHHFSKDVSLMPTLRAMIIGCVDPRVDGRITPETLQTLGMLNRVAQGEGANLGGEFHLIVLHHTQCGIARLEGNPDMLASYFGICKEELRGKAVTDPHAAVAVDVAALKVNPVLPGNWLVSGLVYDVTTGLVDVVVPPAPLRHS